MEIYMYIYIYIERERCVTAGEAGTSSLVMHPFCPPHIWPGKSRATRTNIQSAAI